MPALPRLPAPAVVALYVVTYVALDWASYLHPVAPFAITPWNPPPGLSLALLLVFGLRWAPALFVAAWIADLLVRDAAPFNAAAHAVVIAVGYSAVAAFLLRAAHFDWRLQSLRDLALLAAAAAVGSMAVATGYVLLQVHWGTIAGGALAAHVVRFWVGDFVGLIVAAPFLLAWGPRLLERTGWRPPRDAPAQALSIPLVLWIVFSIEPLDPAKFFYLLFVPLVWIAARHGFTGATAALLGIQAGLIVAIELAGQRIGSVYELQSLMTALAVTGLFLGMAVSERRSVQAMLQERERQLDHALRVAAGSELASSLAHELNQPLSAAANFVRAASLLAREADADRARLDGALQRAVAEMDRAADVVRRLREFFRSGSGSGERVELQALLRTVEGALRPRLERHRVALELRLPAAPVAVSVDRVQIELVARNLLNNAIDAIASSGAHSGTIEVGAQASADGLVQVVVRDSGPGIDAEIAPRLFEPFSTSKPEGMGLGLAISRSIVEAHGGRLWSERRARGAGFAFTLPLAATVTKESA